MHLPAEQVTRVQIPAPAFKLDIFFYELKILMDESEGIVSAIVAYGDEYLCLDRSSYGTFVPDFVAGSIEKTDETPLSTAMRELEEETSLPLESIYEVESFEPYTYQSRNKTFDVHPFRVELNNKLNPQISGEHFGSEWRDLFQIEKSYRENLLTPGRYFNFHWVREGANDTPEIRGRSESWPEVSEEMLGESNITEAIDKTIQKL